MERTRVIIADDESIQIGRFMHRSMPNPFTASAVIEYDLPVSTHVEIDVFDLTGRRVATLVNAYRSSGCHQVTWNPDRTPPGIYFYAIRAGECICTAKIVLID